MIFIYDFPFTSASEMDFKVQEGDHETLKGIDGHHDHVGGQEKISNSIYFIMAKAVTFWPWWQPFNSFCFEGLYFFLCFSFFFLLLKKEWGGGGGEHGPPASLLGVAGPVYSGWLWILYSLKVIPVQINQRNSTIELSSSFQAEIRQGRVAFYLGRVVFYLSTALCEWH